MNTTTIYRADLLEGGTFWYPSRFDAGSLPTWPTEVALAETTLTPLADDVYQIRVIVSVRGAFLGTTVWYCVVSKGRLVPAAAIEWVDERLERLLGRLCAEVIGIEAVKLADDEQFARL